MDVFWVADRPDYRFCGSDWLLLRRAGFVGFAIGADIWLLF